MKKSRFLALGLCLGLTTSALLATEFDQFVLPNTSGTYPTFSTILSIEEGAVNEILRREFARSIRYRLGNVNYSQAVRVGDVLEGGFTVDHEGMTEFSFGINHVGIDLQKDAGASTANLVARLDFSLNIGGVFVRNYKYDWNINGTQKPILVLNNEMVLDLVDDIQSLGSVISYQDVCNALGNPGENTCYEYHTIIAGKLKQAFRYLPFVRDIQGKLTDLTGFRNDVADFFRTAGYCKSFTAQDVACPTEIAALELKATQQFAALTAIFESSGFVEVPEIASWTQTVAALNTWMNACSENSAHPYYSSCRWAFLTLIWTGGSYRLTRIYENTVAFLGTVTGLLAPDGRRVGQLPVFLYNGRIYGKFDKDRLLLGVSYDVKAAVPTVTSTYDAASGIMTLTSNAGFSILSIKPVDGWFASNLIVPVTNEVASPLAFDAARGVYEIKVDLKYALLFAYQYKWWKNQYCPSGGGCPPPDYGNMAGTQKSLTVTPSVGGSINSSSTVNVQL